MSVTTARRRIWALGALAALVLVVVLDAAMEFAVASLTTILVVGIVAELAVAIFARSALRHRAAVTPGGLHSAAKWRALRWIKIVAIVNAYAFLAIAAVLVLAGRAPWSADFAGLLALPLASATACAVGFVAEGEPAARRAPQPAAAAADAGARHDLTWVQRAVDARQWNEAASPTPESLDAALQRWGKTRRTGEWRDEQ
ncbi:MAG: hypothetical protein ACYDCK_15365 [Thermoplasmatota archaeon]